MRLLFLLLALASFYWQGAVAAEVTVYKWRDANGQWHYGEKAPKREHRALTIDTDANVTSGNPFNGRGTDGKSPPPGEGDAARSGLPYSPSGIRKMLDDIGQIKKTVERRGEMLDTL